MPTDDLDRLLADELNNRRARHQLRQRVAITPIDSTHVQIDGRRYVNFASNNYLGLTHHPAVIAAIQRALALGAGSGAAGLISGYTFEHQRAERSLARLKGTEASVILPSGYQANLAAIQTLAAAGESRGGGDGADGAGSGRGAGNNRRARFLIDKLVHASLIDAVQATGAAMRVFPHNRIDKLRRLLQEADEGQLQIVVTESIFSMDGDAADLAALASLKREFPFTLLLDEAHATGVFGPAGAGYAAQCGLQSAVDVSVVTLSKALGCVGGAVCGSQTFCDALLNLGRAYIYSTSVPPMIAAAASAAISVCREEPHRQQRVQALADRARTALTDAGVGVVPGVSPIIALLCGDEEKALSAAAVLREKGLLVIAIRPPTVAPKSSRLRITLCCDHTDAEVQHLVDSLIEIAK